jgi:hypothetical protein
VRIPIWYYQEVGRDTLVKEILDNGELVNIGGIVYKIVVI